MLSASALTASASATHDRLGGAGRWLLALPAHHVAGLQVLVRSALAGTTPVALSPELRRHRDALRHRDVWAPVVGTPRWSRCNSTRRCVDPAAAAALAELDAVLIGGGPMPAAIGERAAAAGISVVRTYGMSETAGGCVYDGRPLDGVRIRIEDGRVVLGGPTLATGYRNPLTPDPFAEPGWFRTDDVGAVDDSGVLANHRSGRRRDQHGRADGVPAAGRGRAGHPPRRRGLRSVRRPRRTAGPTRRRRRRRRRWPPVPDGEPNCAPTSRRPWTPPRRPGKSTSSTRCPGAASARWTERSSPHGSPRAHD